MFFHLCVILFTGGSDALPPPPRPDPLPGTRPPPGTRREVTSYHHHPRPEPQKRVGAHPNGMLSCLNFLVNTETSDGSKGRDAPPPIPRVQILSISCSFWGNLAKPYVGAPLESLRPISGKSWIRHWKLVHTSNCPCCMSINHNNRHCYCKKL